MPSGVYVRTKEHGKAISVGLKKSEKQREGQKRRFERKEEHEKCRKGALIAAHNSHIKSIEKKQIEIEKWLNEKHECKNCGKIMIKKYGKGIFCSKSCASSYSNKGRKKTDKAKSNCSKGQNERFKKVDERIKVSNKMKELWKNNDYRNKIIKAHKDKFENKSEYEKQKIRKHWIEIGANNTKNTKIELEVERQLQNLRLEYIKQKYVYDGSRGYLLDFYLPKYKIVIECNGDYWHNLEERKIRDKLLERYCTSKGRKILFLWEHEIKIDKEIVNKKLKEVI